MANNTFHVGQQLARFAADPNPAEYSDEQLKALRQEAQKVGKTGIMKLIRRALQTREVHRNDFRAQGERKTVVDDRSVDGRANLAVSGAGFKFTLKSSTNVQMTPAIVKSIGQTLLDFAKEWDGAVMPDDTLEIVQATDGAVTVRKPKAARVPESQGDTKANAPAIEIPGVASAELASSLSANGASK